DLVDAPGGGVLDGDDGDVGLVGEKGGDGGANARVAGEMALEVASGEELLGGEVAVGVLRAGVGEADPPAGLRGEVRRLLGDGVADDLLEDPAHEVRGDAELAGHPLHRL